MDRQFTCSLSQILFLLIGDRIKNNILNLQEKGLNCLSQEVLYCWQIWKQRISELTVSQDYATNLQGGCPQYLEDVSMCDKWARVSLQISNSENYVIDAVHLANCDGAAQEGLTQILTLDSWRKTSLMTEAQNSEKILFGN